MQVFFEEFCVFGVEIEGVDVECQYFEDGLLGDLAVGEEVDLVEEEGTDEDFGEEESHYFMIASSFIILLLNHSRASIRIDEIVFLNELSIIKYKK